MAAAEGGNMHHFPSERWAQAVPDAELAKHRGGFTGVQWSMEFVAIVSNTQGDVTGIPGAAGTLPPGSSVNVDNGNLQISTLVALGTNGSFNGIGIVNVIPGNFNVVDFHLNLNVNIINVANAAALSQVGAILGRQ
jgi:hypothetical protein